MSNPEPDESDQEEEGRFFALEQLSEEEIGRVAAVSYDMASIVDRRNGWVDNNPDAEVEREATRRGAAMLIKLFLFGSDRIDFTDPDDVLRFSFRNVAAMWVIAPHLLTNKQGVPLTLGQLAKPFGKGKCWLSTVAEAFSDEFGYFSRNQRSKASRPNYAAAARKGWEKRKAKKEVTKKSK